MLLVAREVLGLGGPMRDSIQKGPLCTGRLRGFRGHRPHGPPCLQQITPFYSTQNQHVNRIDLPVRNCRIKSCRLQSAIVYTKTLAHIVRNLAVKLGIHGGAATCATKPPSSTQTLVVACATSSG